MSRAPKTPYNFRTAPKVAGTLPKPQAGMKKNLSPPEGAVQRRKPGAANIKLVD